MLDRRRSFAEAAPWQPPPVVLVPERRGVALEAGLALPTANAVARGAIYRPVLPSYPFGDSEAGPADLVLLQAGAVAARDLPEVLARCAAAGLPLVAEAAGVEVAGATAILATSPDAARRLQEAGTPALCLPAVLEPQDWRDAVPVEAAGTLRLLAFADDPAVTEMAGLLEDLAALEVATLLLVPCSGTVGGFRQAAAGCALALLPMPFDPFGPQAERGLLAAAVGLVVLRSAGEGELLGETARGEIILPARPTAWMRAIGELSVDPLRRAALRRRALRHARSRFAAGSRGAALDGLLRQTLALAGCPLAAVTPEDPLVPG
jgi:hypothetical protein